MQLKVNLSNNKKQREYVLSEDRYLLYRAGRRSGKSVGSCIKAIQFALREKTQGMIVSPKYSQAETLLQVLFDLLWKVEYTDAEISQLKQQTGLPLCIARFNRKDKVLEFYNGSIIYIRSADDPESLRGFSLNWACIDEAAYVKHQAFDNVRRSLSEGEKQYLFLSTTPAGYNWLYEEEKLGTFKVIKGSVYDNEDNLPKDYIEDIRSRELDNRGQQEIYGEYTLLEGRVFSNYKEIPLDKFLEVYKGNKSIENPRLITNNIIQHIPNLNDGITSTSPHKHKYTMSIGIDIGYSSQSAIICVIKIDNDTYYTISEHYETNLTTNDLLDRLVWGGWLANVDAVVLSLGLFSTKDYLKQIPIYIDSARPDVIEEFRRFGFNSLPAKKDRDAGIDLMQRSNWLINPECTNLLEELTQHVYDENGKPIKKFDHAIDATRYAFMGLVSAGEIIVTNIQLRDYGKKHSFRRAI